jgi:hypothetical protein
MKLKKYLGTFWLKIEQFWPFEEISIFSNGSHLSNFQNFNTFRLIFQKLLKKDVKFILQKCAACQDLPTLQF